MASCALHLLTLPREIQDKIYPCLYHTVDIGERLDSKPKDEKEDGDLCIENAPLLSVLLTHSRLYEENKAADCFAELSVLLDTCTYDKCDFFNTIGLMDFALAHVRLMTGTPMRAQLEEGATRFLVRKFRVAGRISH
jgi:hypothetical protein